MAEYKVGDKFVIEIESIKKGLPYPYIMKNSEPYDDCGLDNLPQLVNGVDMYSYNKGMEDAWELMKKINEPRTVSENLEVFKTLGVSEFYQVFELLTPQEAKVKFEAWEKSKVGIEVGDLVYVTNAKRGNGIVSRVDGDWCTVIWVDGSSGNWFINDLTKTGESHADEVAALTGLLK